MWGLWNVGGLSSTHTLAEKGKTRGSWQTSGTWLPITSIVPFFNCSFIVLYPPFFSSRDFCSARSARKCRGDWDSGGVNLLSVLVSLTGLLPPLASTFREEFCCPPSGLHREILLLWLSTFCNTCEKKECVRDSSAVRGEWGEILWTFSGWEMNQDWIQHSNAEQNVKICAWLRECESLCLHWEHALSWGVLKAWCPISFHVNGNVAERDRCMVCSMGCTVLWP